LSRSKCLEARWSLSEQELIDYLDSEGNHGCIVGEVDTTFTWIIKNVGIASESAYPHMEGLGPLKKDEKSNIANISNLFDVPKHPVAVAIEADDFTFQFYKFGVYNKSCGHELTNTVLAGGYATYNGTPYWKIKNSWGTEWRESGYMHLPRDYADNTGGLCRIALQASYPVV
jgi:hypothetical protein